MSESPVGHPPATEHRPTHAPEARVPAEYLRRETALHAFDETFEDMRRRADNLQGHIDSGQTLTAEEQLTLIDYHIVNAGRMRVITQGLNYSDRSLGEALRGNNRSHAETFINHFPNPDGPNHVAEGIPVEGMVRYIDSLIGTYERVIEHDPEMVTDAQRNRLRELQRNRAILAANSVGYDSHNLTPEQRDQRVQQEAYLIHNDPLRSTFSQEHDWYTAEHVLGERREFRLQVPPDRRGVLAGRARTVGALLAPAIIGFAVGRCSPEIPPPPPPVHAVEYPGEKHEYQGPSFKGFVDHHIARVMDPGIAAKEQALGRQIQKGDVERGPDGAVTMDWYEKLTEVAKKFAEEHPTAYEATLTKTYFGIANGNPEGTLKGAEGGFDPSQADEVTFVRNQFVSPPNMRGIIEQGLAQEQGNKGGVQSNG